MSSQLITPPAPAPEAAGVAGADAFPLDTSARPSWRDLARKAALPAGLVAAAAIALVVAGGPLQAFADALRRAFDADPRWVVAGAAFEALSFAGYILLLWHVAGRKAPQIGVRRSAQITFAGAAATRLLPTAGIGGAALTLWSLRRAGIAGRDGTRTLLTFLVVLYSVFLGSILVAGTLLSLGVVDAGGPLALTAIPAALAGLGIVAALALGLRARRLGYADADEAAAGRLGRARSAGRLIGEAVSDALTVVRNGDPRLAGALLWWGFDVAVLWATLHSFGAPPAFAAIVLAYFVGQVGNTLPLPGAVSGGMVGVLVAFGVELDLALASVLAYRAIALWLPAPAGAAALASLRRSAARWMREDAEAPAAEEQPLTVPAEWTPRSEPRKRRESMRLCPEAIA